MRTDRMNRYVHGLLLLLVVVPFVSWGAQGDIVPRSPRESLGPVLFTNLTEIAFEPAPGEDMLIRYTLDGAAPTQHSPVYCRSIRIAQSTHVRAAFFRGGEQVGGVARIRCIEQSPRGVTQAARVAINVDYHEVPDLANWAEKVRADGEAIYADFNRVLGNEGFTPPRQALFTFKADMKGVAGTSGNRVSFAADWIRSHPDDYGCAIHELAHIAQSYPRYDPPWLVEALADYARFWMYEPVRKRPHPRARDVKPKDSYQRGAAFLAWLAETHGQSIIRKLSTAIRKRRYRHSTFEELTGKSLESLVGDFRQTLRT